MTFGRCCRYPVMWDEAAINVPIAIRKKQQSRARRRRVLFHTCKKVPSAPKDAHYLRVNPCFYEKKQPLCFLLKVTASGNASLAIEHGIRGWGEFHPTMTSERTKREIEKKMKNLKQKENAKSRGLSPKPGKILRVEVEEAKAHLRVPLAVRMCGPA